MTVNKFCLLGFWKNRSTGKFLKRRIHWMRLPSLKSTLIFTGGFASCLLCLAAIVFSGYYFWLKPMVSNERKISRSLEPPSMPTPRPAKFNFSIVDASLANLSANYKNLDLQTYRGCVVVLNFWATWCPPCQAELPSLGKLRSHYAGKKDVAVLCISEELPSVISNSKNAIESGAPLYSLNGQQIPQTYATKAIPATFVIDTNGMIVFEHVGSADWADASVIKFIDSLRGKKSLSTNAAASPATNSFEFLTH